MWQELDRVAWATFGHNYGDAADVPALLRGCADRDAARAAEACGELDNRLYHQGGWVCSAATAALPFLLGLAGDRAVYHRAEIVELIGRIAREATEVERRLVDEGWPEALVRALPLVLELLADEDPGVRREATLLVAAGGLPYTAVAAPLWRRWREEPDRIVRWDLVLAFGELLVRHPDAADIRAELHRLLADDDLQIRLAAVHALAKSEPALPPTQAATLIEAVLHDDAEGWQRSAWIGGTRQTIVHSAGRLLGRDPAAATAFTIGVSRSTDIDQRVATLGQAGLLLAEWRTIDTALLPFLADQVNATETEVRYRAAFLLGCLGADSAAHADRLAELVDDVATRDSGLHYAVGDAALWALARQHDPRCVPGLIGRLTGDRLGFDVRSSHTSDRYLFTFQQPGIHETLTPLREHAADLIDAVVARIATTTDTVLVSLLCDVLGAWGPAAGAAVPVLLPFLTDDDRWPAAARALGGIGPAAAPAADALRRRAEDQTRESAAAWAHWRVSGDPQPAVDVLVRLTDGRALPAILRHVADLGPLAAAAVPRLRQLTESTDDWAKAEAAHALWRVSGEPAEAVAVLTTVARPLAEDRCSPVMRAALRYLADMGTPAASAAPIARAVLNNPRRLAYFGSWRTFVEDEEVRAAAASLAAPAG